MRRSPPRPVPPPPARPRRARRVLLALLAGALVAGCARGGGGEPRPAAVTPDRGLQGAPVAVAVRGEGFDVRTSADFEDPSDSGVDAGYRLLLGSVALENVTYVSRQEITATVPAGLATGTYDLTVIDPWGRQGTLAGAFRVLAPGEAGALVARYRLDPIGAQVAYQPFAATIVALDAAGAVVTDFNGAVRLTDATGTGVPTTAARFVAGRWTGLLEVRAPHPGDTFMVLDDRGASGMSSTFPVRPPPAAAARFSTPPAAAVAGRCTGPVAIALVDAFGLPVQAEAATPLAVAAAPAAGFTLYQDGGCTQPVTAPTVPAGQGAISLWFVATRAGTVDVTASSPELAAALQQETVAAGAAAAIAFVSAPPPVNAGACSFPATVEVRDAFGNPSPPGALALALAAAPAGGVTFSTDDACGGAASSIPLAADAARASFRLKGNAAGTVHVTVSAPGLASASQDVSIVPEGTAIRLAFLTPPLTADAGACSGAITVQAQDSFGNGIVGSAAIDVGLAAAPDTGFTFYSDASCRTPATTVRIPAGQPSAGIWFRGTQAGAVGVTASATGLAAATQTETIGPAAPARVVFTSGPQSLVAGSCSAPVALQVQDAYGNAAPVSSPVQVALTAASPTGFAFYADAACATPISSLAIGAGASGGAFRMKGTRAGSEVVSAAPSGLAGASQTEEIRPAPARRLAFVSAPQTVVAGACSDAVTVEVRDEFDNVATVPGGAQITLAAAPSTGFAFFADACATPATTVAIPAGGSTASFRFSGTTDGSVTVTASGAGLDPDSQAEYVGAAPAVQLAFATAAQTVPAGTCSAPVTVESVDALGNPSPIPGGAAIDVTLSASPATGVTFFADAGCAGTPVASVPIAGGAGAATFSFRATTAGKLTLTAASASLRPGSQDEIVTALGADHLAFKTAPQSVEVGACSAPVTVRVEDAYGNPSPVTQATSAALTAAPATGFAFYADSACATPVTAVSLPAGGSSATFRFKGAVEGAVSITAAIAGVGSASQTESVIRMVPDRSPPRARFTVDAGVLISGGSIDFDASGSSDDQTATARLSVSWDFEATATSMDGAATPGSAPWTGWSMIKTAKHAFVNNGAAPVVYHPRLAVRDAEAGPGGPDVAYASATIVVLPNGNGRCTVDTASDADDGATSCYAKGADGRLSLREAIRVANTLSSTVAIDFAGPMTIPVSGTLTLSRAAYLVARPGVVLDGGTLSVTGTGVVIAGLELSRQGSPVVIEAGGEATLRDVQLHDGAGIVVRGRAVLDRIRLTGCTGTCVGVDGASAYLALFGSELRGSGTNTGLALTSCATTAWSPGAVASPYRPFDGAVVVAGNLFAGFGTAVDSSCSAAVVSNDTFADNDTGVRGVGDYLLDSIFSGQTTAAVSAATCPGFAHSARHLVWRNGSDGCLASELAGAPAAGVTFSADPLYLSPGAGDWRLRYGSPARDTAAGTNLLELDGPGPGRFLGANADRGGRETY